MVRRHDRFSGGGLDLSTAQYLEIWVNDFDTIPANSTPRGGTVHIDFGRIDEDFYQPDQNEFDNEDKLPYGWTIYEDIGLRRRDLHLPDRFQRRQLDREREHATGASTAARETACRTPRISTATDTSMRSNGYYTVSFNLADSAEIDIQRDFPKEEYSAVLERSRQER